MLFKIRKQVPANNILLTRLSVTAIEDAKPKSIRTMMCMTDHVAHQIKNVAANTILNFLCCIKADCNDFSLTV